MKWGINKDFAKLAAILAAAAVVSFGMERILAYVFYGKDSFYWGRYLGIFVVLELAACLVCFREIVARKAEVAALVVTLSVGTLYALAVPASTGISWDDEWHYNCSMAMSHLLNPDVSKAEYYYADKDCFLETALEHKNYDRESQKETYQKIEKLYQQKEKTLPGRYWPRYRNLCYMPAGFGLWLGRLLSLPYHVAFMVGRWFSMLFYSILVFLAIRKLKSGKILAAAVALIPFNIFMASSYSYDHWITAWLLYGTCCLFGELQQPEKKMSVFEWIFMLLAFLIGVGPKMLYIPLVLLALFKPSAAEAYDSCCGMRSGCCRRESSLDVCCAGIRPGCAGRDRRGLPGAGFLYFFPSLGIHKDVIRVPLGLPVPEISKPLFFPFAVSDEPAAYGIFTFDGGNTGSRGFYGQE